MDALSTSYWYQSCDCEERVTKVKVILQQQLSVVTVNCDLSLLLVTLSSLVRELHPTIRLKLSKAFWHDSMLTNGFHGENGFGGYAVEETQCAVQTIKKIGSTYLHLEFLIGRRS
jgi:hypothetical protein